MGKADLSLRAVASFVAIAECGGIARAAEELGVSQPAVTLQLQQLERRLGVKLFERRQRQVHLTDAGQRALEPARKVLGAISAFETAATQRVTEKKTALLVAAIEPTASSRLPGVLSAVRHAAPGVPVKITVTGGDNIARAAQRGAIDVALTVPTQLRGWVYEPLFTERLVALVRSDHRLARQASVSLSQLSSEQLILTDETCVYRRAVERAFLRSGVKATRIIESSSLASLPNSVAGGLGTAVVPKPYETPVSPELRVVAIRERIDVTIGLLRPKAFDDASALGQFIISAYDLRKR